MIILAIISKEKLCLSPVLCIVEKRLNGSEVHPEDLTITRQSKRTLNGLFLITSHVF